MRMLIVGAGATGGYFGGRLCAAGRDVTFLVRRARRDALARGGLRIVGPDGAETVAHPPLLVAEELNEPFDAVMLTVKAYALESALADMRSAIGPDTAILPTLNGMRHMDRLAEAFSPRNVMGCLAKIAGSIDGDGRIHQATPMHDLVYGELSGARSERAARIDAFLTGAGFDARLSDSILPEMWGKWAMLASLGAVCCLMRGDVGQVASARDGQPLAKRILDEVVAIVSAVGAAPPPPLRAGLEAMLTDLGSRMTSSMYRDLVAGQPVEVEQILGDLLRRAHEAGIDAPLIAAATVSLRVYEGARAAR